RARRLPRAHRRCRSAGALRRRRRRRPALARGGLRSAGAGGDGVRRAGRGQPARRAAGGGGRCRTARGARGRARADRGAVARAGLVGRARGPHAPGAGPRRALHLRAHGRARGGSPAGDRRATARAVEERRLMCGIAGIVGGTPGRGVLDAMLSALEHRGPDDRGAHVGDGVALGMTRLAIIDLVTGRQPMSSDDGSATLVFNGEIYNFRAVRAELEARGQRFRTQSDTEVILRAWQLDGERCVDRLRGMFAFAIWDARRGTLFLARDRVGKKPLYYWQGGGTLAFASEIKALLCHPGPGRAVDWPAFHHYLAYGYTPAARSAFAGIAKLPPDRK